MCELAHELFQEPTIANLILEKDIAVVTADISESEQLVEIYGISIPVLKSMSTAQELGWPYDTAELSAFLRNNLVIGD